MASFIQGFQAGANVARMRQQRQERMMELRSQEAMNMIRERQLVEEMGMRTQLFQQKQAEEQRIKSSLAAADSLYADLAPRFGDEEARRQVDLSLLRTNPAAAKLVGDARKSQLEAQMVGKPTVANIETERHNRQMEQIAAAKAPMGMTIETNPDGTMRFVQGPGVGGERLTNANQTKVQEKQIGALETIDIANRLEPLLDNETVGMEAWAKSWVNDRILAQWNPEMASKKRAKAEVLAADLRATAIKALKSDSNISEKEREQIVSTVPKINDPVNSPARATELVGQVRHVAAVQAVVDAAKLGSKIPKSAVLILDDEEIASLSEQGLITPRMALEAYNMKKGQ